MILIALFEGFQKNTFRQIRHMFVFESKDPMFFYKATNSKPYFFSEDAEVMGKENFFTIESFYDICSYIKLNSSKVLLIFSLLTQKL